MLTEEEKQKRKSTKTVAELYEGQIFTFMTDHAFALHLEENRRPKPWKEYDLTSTKTEEKAPSEESEEEIMVKPKKLKHYMMTTQAQTHRVEQTDQKLEMKKRSMSVKGPATQV